MATFTGATGNDTITPDFVSDDVLRDPAGSFPGAGGDSLDGGLGNDSLDGGLGDDTLVGGGGDDTFVVDSASDVVVELAGGGIDLVVASVSATLGTAVDNLTLLSIAGAANGNGNALGNVITGNEFDNSLGGAAGNDTLIAGDGNDTLAGGAGADSMEGGFGDDWFSVNDVLDVVVETGTGDDTVSSSVTYTLAGNIEDLILTGSAVIDGFGNAKDNTIVGNSAANWLTGVVGDDTLSGFGGNDTLNGGSGDDLMQGGAGDDLYLVDSVGDVVVEAGVGIDQVESFITYTLGAALENLVLLGPAAIDGTGNGRANVISGNAAVNVLDGGAGADLISGFAGADTIIGGAGPDTLNGGGGADRFDYNLATESGIGLARDLIQDFAGAGVAGGDIIDLADIWPGELEFLASGEAFTVAGQLRVKEDATVIGRSLVQVNLDGDPGAEMEIILDDGAVAASAYAAIDFAL